MTLREAARLARTKLNDVPDRDVDAAWILAAVTGLSRGELVIEGERKLTEREEALLTAILDRRATREPLQYIFGSVPFYDLDLKCDPRALIPRDETALLAEEVILRVKKNGYTSVLDLCTGSGALALAIKKHCPDCRVTGADLSPDALALAKENAQRCEITVEWVESDLFSALENRKFDVIVSNPPYVCTKDMDYFERELSFEPAMAFDGGADGLDFYRDITEEAPAHLSEHGLLAYEIGWDQGIAVRRMVEDAGFTDVCVKKDYAGLDRQVFGIKR